MLGWELPPHNSGGLGVACYQLCKALSRNDLDIEFIVPYEADHGIDFMDVTAAQPAGIIAAAAVADPYKSQTYRAAAGWTDIHAQQQRYEQAVHDIIDEKEFDIVHAHDWLTFRAALRIKSRRQCPVILHVHSVESDRAANHRGNPLVREIEETALNLADKIIAVSEHTRQCIIRDYAIPGSKITVVHNSLDRTELPKLDAGNSYRYLSYMKSQGYKVVVNVGRLTIQKGLPNLLQAAQLVLRKEPRTFFLLVGSGEQYQELVGLSAELGIGRNVLFAGFQRGQRWRDAFALGDLFVMPSISEPFGLTPLEALGYGTPSLISKQSGVSEVLQSCLKVDYWDIKHMANQITAALQNEALLLQLQRDGQREYERLSWAKAAQKVTSLYHSQLQRVAA